MTFAFTIKAQPMILSVNLRRKHRRSTPIYHYLTKAIIYKM